MLIMQTTSFCGRWKGQQVELNLKPLPVQCDEQEGGDSSGSNYPA
jgi:hypothetical protein